MTIAKYFKRQINAKIIGTYGQTQILVDKPHYASKENYPKDILSCQHCESNELHFFKLELFFRKEDGKTGLHIETDYEDHIVDDDVSENISPRRDSVLLYFWCEHCGEYTVVSFIQHKGYIHCGFQEQSEHVTKKIKDIKEIYCHPNMGENLSNKISHSITNKPFVEPISE